ncbi:hypothetical protein DFQ28_011578 [Apophysomyces sp. BC1034]|nr:hypothetical protein DFQ28_011578 [Apophysomyces sp. BC1034]
MISTWSALIDCLKKDLQFVAGLGGKKGEKAEGYLDDFKDLTPDIDQCKAEGLQHVNQLLLHRERCLEDFPTMPSLPSADTLSPHSLLRHTIIAQQLDYDTHILQQQATENIARMNCDQPAAFNAIVAAIDDTNTPQ